MHAVSIEAGGIVPLPRVGGALSHAVGSIRNLPRHCQTPPIRYPQCLFDEYPSRLFHLTTAAANTILL